MAIYYCKNAFAIRNRFGLCEGQWFAYNVYRNLWWEIDGEFFGYGDLTLDQVFRIQGRLENDEVFQGWNEHHTSAIQQTDIPMIRITREYVMKHQELLEETKGGT